MKLLYGCGKCEPCTRNSATGERTICDIEGRAGYHPKEGRHTWGHRPAAIRLLDKLYWEALFEGTRCSGVDGSTILWNAMYHLECASGYEHPRIPTANRIWDSREWWELWPN